MSTFKTSICTLFFFFTEVHGNIMSYLLVSPILFFKWGLDIYNCNVRKDTRSSNIIFHTYYFVCVHILHKNEKCDGITLIKVKKNI